MIHVVQFSGGIGSWATAKLVAQRHGTADMLLLFADTMIEHPDTYAFLEEAAANVGAPLVKIADGRTPFQVFRDERFLGNSRADPCSKILKRQLLDRWQAKTCDPEQTTLYFGIHWSERDRFEAIKQRKAPWRCEAPLCEPPFIPYGEMHAWAKREGLRRQFLYEIGMPHANCGGGCVKMGQGGWVVAYHRNRETFDRWEAEEDSLRELLGDVSMMKDRRGGETKTFTLRELRHRIESGDETIDLFDMGACGCFASSGVEAVPVEPRETALEGEG